MNNSRFKFRAWNRDENVMCYDDEDDSSSYWDGVCCSILGLINANISSDLAYDYMQFTGLQDKNGKDIFEGDIVKYLNDGEEEISTVAWCEDRDFNGWEFTAQNEEDGIEIIGNIYENPELLK